jgi:extracellular elastinolytic metalloproteinase
MPTVLDAGPFGDKIKASLKWFPLGDGLRLTWEVILTMPDYEEQYRAMVDAENGDILYCKQLVKYVAARGNVYRVDGGSARQMTNFPIPLADYGLPIPNDITDGFPDDWVDSDSAVGNSVNAHLGYSGDTIQGEIQNNILTFDPNDPEGDDQKVLNIFYLNCYMHDFFYLLGFREDDGCFQQDNFGRGGRSNDRVDARAHSGAVNGTANMGTPIDGRQPEMNMGLVTSTNRHTAFDSTVVFHEFMHGVTNRLVGGAMNVDALEEPQSGGMGEGWGDYVSCTINNTIVTGAWVVNNPNGIRKYPYDSQFPDNFGDIGTGRYNKVHNIGEIWCATLVEMNRNIGKVLGVQLVVDALKLSRSNPGFLDMRNSILAALNDKRDVGQLTPQEYTDALNGIWTTFAKFGMGPDAKSNGASLSGIVADFNTPDGNGNGNGDGDGDGEDVHVEASPNIAIPDFPAAGVDSVLTVSKGGHVTRLKITINIEHTYIGDLIVSLITPGGSEAVLHNRIGAGTHNLTRSYTSEDTSALEALDGEEAKGNWVLKIVDLAGRDVGTLHSWSIDAGIEATSQTVREENTDALPIEDDDPVGVSSSITIAEAGEAQAIKIDVDITHPYIGDLRVELLSPSGQNAILHNRQGRGQDNIIRSYNSISNSSLGALLGQQIQNDWVLKVADLAGRDIGKLNKWSLELTYVV